MLNAKKIINCIECENAFVAVDETDKLCIQCIKMDRRNIAVINDYLIKNDDVVVEKVLRAANISLKTFKRYLKDRKIYRLNKMILRCEICKTKIINVSEYLLCDSCLNQINPSLALKQKEYTTNGFNFIDEKNVSNSYIYPNKYGFINPLVDKQAPKSLKFSNDNKLSFG